LRFPDLPWIGDDGWRRLFAAVEAALAATLAWQAAALFWILLSPQTPVPLGPVASRSDGLAVLTRFDPFFRSAPAAMSEAVAQAFRLHGVRAGDGGAGSAILGGPDGLQTSFAVGDEVAPGVRLDSVADDHVVLARGGARTSLYFPTATPTVAQDQVQP